MSGFITEWEELLRIPFIKLDLEIGLMSLVAPVVITPFTAAIFMCMLESLRVFSTIWRTISIKIDSLSLLVSI
jgi:hypothetical protein